MYLMDMNQIIKGFNSNASEFGRQKNTEILIQNLQMLSATDDLSVFDTGSFEAAEFYSQLHKLLIDHSTDSELVWSIVSVLQVAVRNSTARSALVHTYHFIHPLTTLLDIQISSERKLQVLKILQELSYGIVICWQEAHLPKLIGCLLDIITSSDSELIPMALGVMVNICYRNKPAVYTLMNCIDIKAFLRTILNLQRENNESSVQVCKLVMILDHLSVNVPDAQILSFVRTSFLKMNKAFNCGNAFLMRHIVDFFHDAKESEHGKKILLMYQKYEEDIDNLINTLSAREVPNNWQCVQKLIDFMYQLVELKLLVIMPMYSRMAYCILPWVQVEGVAPAAIRLLSLMLAQSRNQDKDVYKALCAAAASHLQVFVEMLHNECKPEITTNETRMFLTSLLYLFCELAEDNSLSASLANDVDKEELKKLLLPLISLNNQDCGRLFQPSVCLLYVEVLSFVSELSRNDKEWLFLYVDLLQKEQILKALAAALYCGCYEVKQQILYLVGTTSFSKDRLTVLSKCMTDLNQLFMFTPNSNPHQPYTAMPCSQLHQDFTLSMAKRNTEDLDRLIEKLDDLYKKDQIQDASLAGIIELYNYKLSEMRRAEQSLQSSLAAADSHRAQLTQRTAQMCAETTRLHQLVYCSQQTLEGRQMELKEVRSQLHAAQESANTSHIKFKQLKHDVHSKNIIIKEKNEEILKMEQCVEEQKRNIEELEKKTTNLEEKIEELNKCTRNLEAANTDLFKANTNLEEKLESKEKLIMEKEILLEEKISQIQSLEKEMANQQRLIKGLEKTLKDKEKEISVQQNQLVDLERMRKIIFEITGGKKTNF